MPPSAKTPSAPPLLRPQATIMLSRVAHSLYWMSRYIERAENVARLLDVNLQFLSDFQDVSGVEHNTWGPLILSTGQEDLFSKFYESPDSRTVMEFSLSTCAIPTRFSRASTRRGKTRAWCATRSRWKCGKPSTSSTCC
jgi:hypothetical protein